MPRLILLNRFLISTALGLLPLVGAAATDAAAWSWAQCLAAAEQQRSPEWIAASLVRESARLRLEAATAALRPQFALSAGAGLVDDLREDSSGGRPGFQASLTGEMPLYPNRGRHGAVQLREAERLAADLSGARLESDYLWRLRVAFVDLLRAQEALPLANDLRVRRQALVDAVEARYLAGQEHAGHVAVSQSALTESDQAIVEATRTLSLGLSRLNLLLGFESGRIARVSGSLGCVPPPDNPDALTARIRATPEYAAAEAELQILQARAAMIDSQSDYQLDAVTRISPSSASWTRQEPDWFVGVRLSVPLYDGGRNRLERLAAERDVRHMSARMLSRQRDLQLEFQSAWAEYRTASDRQALQAAAVESANLRADIARREYETGLTGLVSWEAAENDRAHKLRTALDVRHRAALAQAQWERLMGLPTAILHQTENHTP